jgi:hypothetical protein
MAIQVAGGEKALTAELIVALVLTFVGRTLKEGVLPNPQNFVGLVVAFSMLGLFSAFGTDAARISGAFGLLLLFVIGLRNIGAIAGVFGVVANSSPVHLDSNSGGGAQPTAQTQQV